MMTLGRHSQSGRHSHLGVVVCADKDLGAASLPGVLGAPLRQLTLHNAQRLRDVLTVQIDHRQAAVLACISPHPSLQSPIEAPSVVSASAPRLYRHLEAAASWQMLLSNSSLAMQICTQRL